MLGCCLYTCAHAPLSTFHSRTCAHSHCTLRAEKRPCVMISSLVHARSMLMTEHCCEIEWKPCDSLLRIYRPSFAPHVNSSFVCVAMKGKH